MEIIKAEYKLIRKGEIDLNYLMNLIWNKRSFLVYCMLVFTFGGIVLLFITPKKYTAKASILPSETNSINGIGNLGALAGMAGVNLSSMLNESNSISPELYEQVVNSFLFKIDLINSKYYFKRSDTLQTIMEYANIDTIESPFLKYTIHLPWTLNQLYKKPSKKTVIKKIEGINKLSNKERRAFNFIEKLIVVEVNDKTGLVTVSAEANEPIFVCQLVNGAVNQLQEYIKLYKIQQSRDNMEFIQEQHALKQVEYENVQKQYFRYMDSHRNIVSERVDIKFQKLKDEYNIISAVYKGLAQQLEQAKIAVNEQTPVFMILEPAIVPNKNSSPNIVLFVILSVLFGFIFGIAWIVLNDEFQILIK